MSQSLTRRKLLKNASGFAAGVTTANTLPLLANLLTANPVNAQTTQASNGSGNLLEFIGPFPSWSQVKRDFKAVGDGIADDTSALQQALNQLGTNGRPHVLYLPAGTYRITKTLTMTSHIYVSIIGEDPSNTKIKWDGAKDGIMLYMNGVRYSKLARLTFDGSNKAVAAIDQSWNAKVPDFDTGNEYLDNTFQDVGYGIYAGGWGHGAAESAVIGCKFLRNSYAGIITKNFNALDWFIWHSTFQDCKVGVTNDPGAGHFHVFESIFQNSTEADIKIQNTSYFSLHNNFSLNSKAFFVGRFIGQNGALLTIQGNRIIDTVDDAAIKIENLGPVFLIDNVIRSRAGVKSPVVQYYTFAAADLISIGNKFTVSNAISFNGRSIIIDDLVVSRDGISAIKPNLPGVLPRKNRRVFEVPKGSSASTIQEAIDAASQLRGDRPVVHLPSGGYSIDRTIVIPAGSDVQLIGDGCSSSLSWAGSGVGPVLRLAGPSKATLSEFTIDGGDYGKGITVENADQSGARVFMQQPFLDGGKEHNLLVDGLDNARVELHNFYHSNSKGTSVKVVGGVNANQGKRIASRTNIFAGASSNSNVSYAVTNGGRLLTRACWYETGSLPRFIQLTGKGAFTFQGGRIATPANQSSPAIEINNFSGKATLLAGIIDDRIVVKGNGSYTQVLALGMQGNTDRYLNSTNAQSALLYSRKYQQGSYPVPNQTNVSDLTGFVRQMLAHARYQQPAKYQAIGSGITDVKVYRVRVQRSAIGVTLKP